MEPHPVLSPSPPGIQWAQQGDNQLREGWAALPTSPHPSATPRSSGEEVGKILQGLGQVPCSRGEGAQRGIPAVAPQAHLEEAATVPSSKGEE